MEEVEHEMKGQHGSLSGRITVAIPSEFGVKWLDDHLLFYEYAAEPHTFFVALLKFRVRFSQLGLGAARRRGRDEGGCRP